MLQDFGFYVLAGAGMCLGFVLCMSLSNLFKTGWNTVTIAAKAKVAKAQEKPIGFTSCKK
jgi:hypothetical protein